ncbi:MAG: phosphatase PAP2 family protein, partial [Muribaculaceae bacterium]|nr:phosphatase PAP2 family protein [Muribaculaceae bacterium]
LVVSPRRLVRVTLFGRALLNCWSRMYLGVHYPGDLIAGGLVGAFCGWLSFRMFMWLIDRMVMRRAPREAVRFRIGFASVSELSVGTDGIVAFVGLGTSLIVLTVSVLSYLI